MATKKEYLSYLSFLIGSGTISKKDLESAYFKATGDDFIDPKITNQNKLLENVEKNILLGLSIFGGVILCFVVFLLLNSYWTMYDPFFKLSITLGMGAVLFVSGVVGYRLRFLVRIPNIAILLSSILLPLGLQVLVKEFFPYLFNENIDQLIYFFLGILYLSFYLYLLKNTLLFVSIINFSWAYLLLMQYRFVEWVSTGLGSFLKVEGSFMTGFLTLGLVYLLLAYYFQKTPRKALNDYLVSSACVLIFLSLLLSFYVFKDFYFYLIFVYSLIYLLGYYFSFRFKDLRLLLLNFVFSILQAYILLVEGNLVNFKEFYIGDRVFVFWVLVGLSFFTFSLVYFGTKRMGKSLL